MEVSRFTMIVPKRIIIYPKDVMNMTGTTRKTATRMLNRIKKQLGKPEGGLVTVQEFCKSIGISEQEAYRFILD